MLITLLLLQAALTGEAHEPVDIGAVTESQDAAYAAQAARPAAAQAPAFRRMCAGGMVQTVNKALVAPSVTAPSAVYRGEPGSTLNPVWVPGQYPEEGFYNAFDVPGPDGCPQAKPMHLPFDRPAAEPAERPKIKLSGERLYRF